MKRRGFTLIEMMITVAIVGLVLPVLFGIIFSLVRLQVQVNQLQRLKETGDYVSNQILNTVRQEAISVANEECFDKVELGGSTTYLLFENKTDTTCFGYYVNDSKLYAVDEVGSKTLVGEDDTDFPVEISSDGLTMTEINDYLAKISFTIVTTPETSFLKPQSLSYQFYLYLRH